MRNESVGTRAKAAMPTAATPPMSNRLCNGTRSASDETWCSTAADGCVRLALTVAASSADAWPCSAGPSRVRASMPSDSHCPALSARHDEYQLRKWQSKAGALLCSLGAYLRRPSPS